MWRKTGAEERKETNTELQAQEEGRRAKEPVERAEERGGGGQAVEKTSRKRTAHGRKKNRGGI